MTTNRTTNGSTEAMLFEAPSAPRPPTLEEQRAAGRAMAYAALRKGGDRADLELVLRRLGVWHPLRGEEPPSIRLNHKTQWVREGSR